MPAFFKPTRVVRALCALSLCAVLLGLNPPPANAQPAAADQVTINFPDRIDLTMFTDYAGKTLDVRFLYGEELKGQFVELRPAPLTLPKVRLLPLLSSLLRVRDLVLIAEEDRIYRIVRAEQSMRTASTLAAPDDPTREGSYRLVTRVLKIPSGDVKGASERLSPYLSFAKGSLVLLPETGQLIITEYEARIGFLEQLVELIGGAAADIGIERIPVLGADPMGLAAQVATIVSESHRLRKRPGSPASIRGDVLPQTIVVVGNDEQIDEARKLIEQMSPVGADLVTRSYALRYLSVGRAKTLLDNVVFAPGSDLTAPASLYEDRESGRLFVTAEATAHNAIQRLLSAEDTPPDRSQRAMRMYRPQNRNAAELLATIGQLLGERSVSMTTNEDRSGANSITSSSTQTGGGTIQLPPRPPRPSQTPQPSTAPTTGDGNAAATLRIEGRDYVLTADEHTNSILAVGTPEFHAQLDALILDLDQRRPQVLIEMTLVAITMSNSMDLGVELEGLDLGDGWDYLLFSNFNLSTIDVATGERTINPGPGGNGVLIGPKDVPIILRALATQADAKVVSTPRILVSDNVQGTLRNVDEAPFTSVNASDTVATTSFAGFESAGTTLSVTPHVSQGEFLSLEYDLTFSNFSGGSSSSGVPPPRTTNSFASTVDVPDGFTLITGGLVVDNKSDSLSEVPYLGRIPGIGKLFQSSSRQKTNTKIFAFIRPTIVRQDDFDDLKLLTLQETEAAGLFDEEDLKGAAWMR